MWGELTVCFSFLDLSCVSFLASEVNRLKLEVESLNAEIEEKDNQFLDLQQQVIKFRRVRLNSLRFIIFYLLSFASREKWNKYVYYASRIWAHTGGNNGLVRVPCAKRAFNEHHSQITGYHLFVGSGGSLSLVYKMYILYLQCTHLISYDLYLYTHHVILFI